MISRILVPTDFSPHARSAVDHARELAVATRATIVLLHVFQSPQLVLTGFPYLPLEKLPDDVHARMKANGRVSLDELGEELAAAGIEVRTMQVDGDPIEEILETVANENIDLIVMGTHGRRGLSRVVMGSVAEDVLRQATCPVVTVAPNAGAPTRPLEA